MSNLRPEFDEVTSYRICVVGVGGGGVNAVNRMIEEDLEEVTFVAVDTSAPKLLNTRAPVRVQIGPTLTRGLGAGAQPEVGRQALKESRKELREALRGADLVFITAGMGGGTGTGAAPQIAEMAREMGALTIAIVTKPFFFEGKKRMRQAEQGLAELHRAADTMIVVPNERVLSVVGKGTTYKEALKKTDEVLLFGIQAISDLIRVTGEVNVDFADVRMVMSNRGAALMGTGFGRGENRVVEAALDAISSPLLDNISISGAAGVLINITGGTDLTIEEVTTITSIIQEAAGDQAEIIFGAVSDSAMDNQVRVTVMATGFEYRQEQLPEPAELPWMPSIVIAWNPEVIGSDEYARVVEVLGDLIRLEGGLGIRRIDSHEFDPPGNLSRGTNPRRTLPGVAA